MMAPVVVRVDDTSQVAAARRAAADLSWRLHFDETTAGRLALVVTELATNLVKHGGGGEVLLRQVETSPDTVEVFALDRGPGMANVARCLEDGYSTAGSPGTGFGAVQRVASGFDVWSRPKSGAAVRIEIAPAGEARREAGFQVGGLSIPAAGETECGDAWSAERRPGSLMLLVVDGLGHGPDAAIAAREAVQNFDGAPGVLPALRVEALNLALRATRGAAVAVAHIDAAREVPVEHPGDQAGMTLEQPRIRGEVMPGGDAVGVHHEHGALVPGIRVFLDAPCALPGGAVLRHEVPHRFGGVDGRADVAQPREAHELAGGIDVGHRHRRSPRGAQGQVQRFHPQGRKDAGR
ncbi:MAG: ATP-binding protein, partial [Candidatus Rokuibacteriota bacterium]